MVPRWVTKVGTGNFTALGGKGKTITKSQDGGRPTCQEVATRLKRKKGKETQNKKKGGGKKREVVV